MPTDRRLDWEGLVNARDLGGYPTTDGRQIRWGSLVRSDSLSALTPAGQDALRAHGIRTVIDLRMPLEVERDPNPFGATGDHGIAYHNLSFVDPATEPPGLAPTLAEDYLGMLQRFEPQVASVVTAVARADDGGVLVHCAAGKDRTGLIVALLLRALGVAPEVIAEDYGLTAANLHAEEQRWLEDGPGDRAERAATLQRVRARPEVMLDLLAAVEDRYGGVESYLRQAGVEPGDLARIRTRFVEPVAGSSATDPLPDLLRRRLDGSHPR